MSSAYSRSYRPRIGGHPCSPKAFIHIVKKHRHNHNKQTRAKRATLSNTLVRCSRDTVIFKTLDCEGLIRVKISNNVHVMAVYSEPLQGYLHDPWICDPLYQKPSSNLGRVCIKGRLFFTERS